MTAPFGFTRLDKSDMPEMSSWFEQPLYVYNLLLDWISSASNRGLTFEENIASQIKEIDFSTVSYSTGEWNVVRIQSTLGKKAIGCTLQQIWASDDPSDATLGGGTGEAMVGHWMEVDGVIQINWIGGLADNTKYTMRLLII